MAVISNVIRPGDQAKPDPYTICFVANVAIEAPWQSRQFVADAMPNDPAAFDAAVQYSVDCLFGALPGQAEQLLSDSGLGSNIRVVSLLVTGLPVSAESALVGEATVIQGLAPRRNEMTSFVRRFNIEADVIFAVSASTRFERAAAYATTDDDAGPGVPFVLSGRQMVHRTRYLIPGTVALHKNSRSLTPLHEFGHAAASFTNGEITDLYTDSSPAVNCLRGRPIPNQFATLDNATFATDRTRDGLGYPNDWDSYHCELVDTQRPAVMDNYFKADNPLLCRHDAITRRFLTDRLLAKVRR